jgi:dTDP-glucose pyrophosphorylase
MNMVVLNATLSSVLRRGGEPSYSGDRLTRCLLLSLSAVFLAAGLSTRYQRPKQLEPVGPQGESLLDYGIHDALAAGAERIVIVTRAALLDDLRDHLEPSWGSHTLTYVLQDSADADAWRPGGTGRAVLAAEPVLDGPCAVANGDDFYGAAAWADLMRFLHDGRHREAALVGYPLSDTLSPAGGVSRAMCQVDTEGAIVSIVEWKDIRDRGASIDGVDLQGRRADLDGSGLVSMNLWGLPQEVFPALRHQADSQDASDDGEFLLSSAMHSLLMAQQVTVRLLPSRSPWFGLTHPADLPTVQARLRQLTAAGKYSTPLHPPLAP